MFTNKKRAFAAFRQISFLANGTALFFAELMPSLCAILFSFHHMMFAACAAQPLIDYEYLFITMPRPRICRRICCEPDVTYFKPRGVPMTSLKSVSLSADEFEAIRLKDLEGLEQTAAAESMQISQPTFHRVIEAARKKVADALVNGKAIRIEGVQ
jgi:predicted DNA-binding protein (UPF0251 family)